MPYLKAFFGYFYYLSELLTKFIYADILIYMEVNEILTKTGLNEKEASVYLALLELGTTTVESVANKAGTKRPTTYLILDELQRKGLASLVPRAKKVLYMPQSPEKLINDLARKQELVKRFLPNMLALYNEPKYKPQVQMFSGKEGIKQVYQEIFECKEVSYFGTTEDLAKLYPEGLNDYLEKIKDPQFRARDLLTPSKEDLEYAKKAVGPNYQIRFLPNNLEFLSDSAIFGNKVVFFSFAPELFALVISSKEISSSLKSLYELAWQVAEPFKK